MKSKKAMEFEIIVKAILALLILVVLIALLNLFVIQRGGGGLNMILNNTLSSAGNVMDNFRKLVTGG